MLADDSMIVKTQNHKQTEKLMKAKKFGDEDCEVVSDPKLNSSRSTITAYDLLELTESEVVGWLRDFGVTGARRFTRRANGKTENTATILLTFDTPSCPSKLELDYITYHVNQYIPNPLMCYGCGRFGHPQLKCPSDPLCLRCGMGKHDGECDAKCINCKKDGHSCLSRDCEAWKKEKEICRIKTEQEISYPQARKQYERECVSTNPARSFASVVRSPSVAPGNQEQDDIHRKVEKLEEKVGKMVDLLRQLLAQQPAVPIVQTSVGSVGPSVDQTATPEVVVAPDPVRETREADVGETEEMDDDVTSMTPTYNSVAERGRPTRAAAQTRGDSRGEGGEWKTVDRGRKKDRHINKMQIEGVDSPSPSPIVRRSSKSTERSSSRSTTTKQSWKDVI